METNVDILIKTQSDNSGLEQYEKSAQSAQKATQNLDKSQKEQEQQSKKSSQENVKLASSFKSILGTVVKLAAAYVSYNFLFKEGIALAQKQKTAENNLEQALINKNKALGVNISQTKAQMQQIKELSSALQEQLAVGDEEFLQASRWFISAGAKEEQLKRLLTLSADLSKTTGQDLNQSAKDIAKSFNDVSGALGFARERGVELNKTEEKMIQQMISLGKESEAAEIILQKLEKTFGGAAKRQAEDFGGTINKLKNTIGDFQEVSGTLGAGLASPVLKDAKKMFEDLIGVFSSDSAKQLTATVSGLVGAGKALAQLSFGDTFKDLGSIFSKLTKDLGSFVKKMGDAGGTSAATVGIIVNGFALIGDTITGLTASTIELGKALGSLATFNPSKIKDAFSGLQSAAGDSFDKVKKRFGNLIDSKEMERQGRTMAKAITSSYDQYYSDTMNVINTNVNNRMIADAEEAGGVTGKRSGALFSEKFNEFMANEGSMIEGALAGSLNIAGSLSEIFGLNQQQNIRDYNSELENLESSYQSLFDSISEKEQMLAEQRQAEAEAKRDQETLELEEELERLDQRTGAFLSSEEKKKKRELERIKEERDAEKARAAEQQKLEKEKSELEKKLALEREELEFQRDTAEWEREKTAFEAQKKQGLFNSSMAMIEAPIQGTLAILKGGAKGGIAGIAAMTAAVTGLIASTISSAVQLSGTANQSFDIPAPKKAFYTGGIVPLTEGSEFLIGGRMGAEERASVRGGSLYIDNAVQTSSSKEQAGGNSIIIQNLTIQTNDPQSFTEQLLEQIRKEQYL